MVGKTEWNCSEWRCLCISNYLNKTNKHSGRLCHVSGFMDYLSPAIQDMVMPADLIIFQRNLVTAQALDVAMYFQGMGKPIAVDLDDAYPILPWSNPAHKFWIENVHNLDPNPIVMLEKGLQSLNGLIAPNRNLLADWAHVTKGYYLPNFARSEWWTDLPTRDEQKTKLGLAERLVIGWGGSVSHYDSWWGSGIREAATIICRNHPEVVWLICGNDKRIYDQLPVPWANKRFQVGVPPQEWPKIVKTFDIGVAPLFGMYDQRRSWIKGLEYTLASVPWCGTEGEPYKDIAQMGALIQNSPQNWENILEVMVLNVKALQQAAEANVPVARQWFIENQIGTYERVYGEIIGDFNIRYGRLPETAYVNWNQPGRVE